MSNLTIITDHKWKEPIYGLDLPKKWRKEFDWIKDDEEYNSSTFIKYNGWVYSDQEFMRIEHNPEFKGWDGYHSDSFFSGVLIKWDCNTNLYMIGRYYS